MKLDLTKISKIELTIAANAIGVTPKELAPSLSNSCLGNEIMQAVLSAYRKGIKQGEKRARRNWVEEL